MPLTSKLQNNTFVLSQYSLEQSHCFALQKVFEHAYCRNLQVVYFDDCQISDRGFRQLLEGFARVNALRSLTYKSNEFGPQSLEALTFLLDRDIPRNLKELVLAKVLVTYQNAILDLLSYLADETCNLESLTVSACQLTDLGL